MLLQGGGKAQVNKRKKGHNINTYPDQACLLSYLEKIAGCNTLNL